MATMPKMPPGYVKAKLAIEGGETIQVLFNPTEYTITKGNNWTFDPIKGNSLPKGKFGGGKPREMQVNLLLDQTLPNGGMSVKDITDKLFKMMEVKATSGAGAGDAVPAARHLPVGRDDPVQGGLHLAHRRLPAVRAERLADPRRRQARAHAGGDGDLRRRATRRTRSRTRRRARTGGLGVHVVKDGDTLQSLAHQTYGDPNRWRLIAEANGVDNPLHLRRGTALNLPRLG